MAATPASVIVISPLTELNIASSKFSKVIFLEPLSVTSTNGIKSSSAIEVTVINSFKSNARVTVLVEALVSIPVPPAIVNVSLSKSIAIVPLSEVTSKSSAVICVST